MPICVEYGLSEGPLKAEFVGVCASPMQQQFALLDTLYQSKTPLPNREDTQRQVLPRCVRMGQFVSDFYMNQPEHTDVVVVTHGTVAISMAAAMAWGKLESLDDSLEKMQGCVAAGFYKMVPCENKEHVLTWSSDYACHRSSCWQIFSSHDTKTTPTCYIPGPT